MEEISSFIPLTIISAPLSFVQAEASAPRNATAPTPVKRGNPRGGEETMLITRRHVLIGGAAAAASLTIFPAFGQMPMMKKKDKYKVGFAQTESNNPWRLAQSASMKDE